MSNQEINDLILSAIEADKKPPAEFILGIMNGEITVSDEVMNGLISKGWINRQRCEVWTRVMGYFRPVSQFNAGKKAEYAERVLPKVEDIQGIVKGE